MKKTLLAMLVILLLIISGCTSPSKSTSTPSSSSSSSTSTATTTPAPTKTVDPYAAPLTNSEMKYCSDVSTIMQVCIEGSDTFRYGLETSNIDMFILGGAEVMTANEQFESVSSPSSRFDKVHRETGLGLKDKSDAVQYAAAYLDYQRQSDLENYSNCLISSEDHFDKANNELSKFPK